MIKFIKKLISYRKEKGTVIEGIYSSIRSMENDITEIKAQVRLIEHGVRELRSGDKKCQ